MSVKSNVENAESAMRKALINALAEGEDQHLCELFEMLMALRDLKSHVNNTIRFTDNTEHYYNRESEFNLDINLSAKTPGPPSSLSLFPISIKFSRVSSFFNVLSSSLRESDKE